MSKYIKYHDNTLPGLGYGADGKLLDNWDPDKDYGMEYAHVYFRINCPLYMRGKYVCSFDCETDHLAFDRDIEKVFTNLGWKVEKLPNGGACMEIGKGKQGLYLHPQHFSGVVLKNEIKEIAEACRTNETFSLEWVDLYETAYDVSDEEFSAMLLQRKEEIRQTILEGAKTTRKYKFVHKYDLLLKAVNRIKMPRVVTRAMTAPCFLDRVMRDFVEKTMDELIKEGLLIRNPAPDLVRTANKTELRQKENRGMSEFDKRECVLCYDKEDGYVINEG